jgi:hypothetical protein
MDPDQDHGWLIVLAIGALIGIAILVLAPIFGSR